MSKHTTNEIPYGYCHCGCGQKTPLYTRSRKGDSGRLDCIKGEPHPYLKSHDKITDPLSRFWAKVDKREPNDCWLWFGAKGAWGGRFSVNGRQVGPHRFIYEVTYGPLDEGLIICHRCDQPLCCNPSHLFAGTQSDNMQDCVTKGRHTAQVHPNKLSRGERHSKILLSCVPNGEAHYRAKMTEFQVREVFRLDALGWKQTAIANHFGVTRGAIKSILTGRNWKHLGLTRSRR